MAEDPPAGFVHLQAAVERQNCPLNLMGVVVQHLPPGKTRGEDYQSTFFLSDWTMGGYHLDGSDGLRVKCFQSSVDELPRIQGTGDVVILRNVLIKEWSGMTLASCVKRQTQWTVFPAAGIPADFAGRKGPMRHFSSPRAAPPTPAEEKYAISLCNSRDRQSFTSPAQSSSSAGGFFPPAAVTLAPPAARDRFSLIKDISVDCFYDLVCQVVKVYTGGGRTVELYVTDYTKHDELFNYEWGRVPAEHGGHGDGDSKKYPAFEGPYGKHILSVVLWEPQADFARDKVHVGDNIFLRNMRTKRDQSGSKLEGALGRDAKYPDRIEIWHIKEREDERVKALLRRKRAYWKTANAERERYLDDIEPQLKRGHEDAEEEGDPDPRTRAKKRSKGKESKGAEPREREAPGTAGNSDLQRHFEVNKHVRCLHPSIPTRPLAEIIQGMNHENKSPGGIVYRQPFHNIKCCARIRVIDFFPPRLADFAVPCGSSEFDVLSDSDGDAGGEDGEGGDSPSDKSDGGFRISARDQKWEWRFSLLVEDGHAKAGGSSNQERPARMKLLVAQEDAEFMLSMRAEDLGKNPEALARLREKLFVLWGDLEERKSQMGLVRTDAKSSRPRTKPDAGATHDIAVPTTASARTFECCIMEYGIKSSSAGRDNVEAGKQRWQGEWERRFRLFGVTIK
ncbi:MAG: hypothetical protein M1838_005820 [Thelocarpon superellum]|nr:MAG: hypothetical protein M1838_005820 [Thelocarpon superellum]